MKALPCLDMVFTKPAEVAALMRVSLEMQSISHNAARTVSIAGK